MLIFIKIEELNLFFSTNEITLKNYEIALINKDQKFLIIHDF